MHVSKIPTWIAVCEDRAAPAVRSALPAALLPHQPLDDIARGPGAGTLLCSGRRTRTALGRDHHACRYGDQEKCGGQGGGSGSGLERTWGPHGRFLDEYCRVAIGAIGAFVMMYASMRDVSSSLCR